VREQLVYPVFRQIDFRGKGRLREALRPPTEGVRVARFRSGMKLQLDLRESVQRDFLFGLYDRRELGIVRHHLAAGGDFVDVGAHIGMYSVLAGRTLGERGRVLSLEPNPVAREQLETNVALNRCSSVIVRAAAASDQSGTGLLHVAKTRDPSFSSLLIRGFEEDAPLEIEVTTVDREVEAFGLVPAMVKIDVEGNEVAVVDGMAKTLELRPALLVEVTADTASKIMFRLERLGYRALRVTRKGLVKGIDAPGWFNVLFLAE
jgi:FkbM family methyltransferase